MDTPKQITARDAATEETIHLARAFAAESYALYGRGAVMVIFPAGGGTAPAVEYKTEAEIPADDSQAARILNEVRTYNPDTESVLVFVTSTDVSVGVFPLGIGEGDDSGRIN